MTPWFAAQFRAWEGNRRYVLIGSALALAAEKKARHRDQSVDDDGNVQFNKASHAPKLGAARARRQA
jgi:hypothetical protein